MTHIDHGCFDGENLTLANQQIPVSRAGWCLIASISAVAVTTALSVLIRHLYVAEAAYQMAARV